MSSFRSLCFVAVATLFVACPDPEPPPPVPNPLEAVPQTESWTLDCLSEPVHVVRTEHNVPHIYAGSERDLGCAAGFVTARDRFFQMDLIARSGLGELAPIFGDQGLETDIETRSRNGRQIAEQIIDGASPQITARLEGYAAGVNAYIDAVEAGQLQPPFEIEVAYVLLGFGSPIEMMQPWTLLHLGGVASTVNYVSGFETTDISWQRRTEQLEAYGVGLPKEELRQAGAAADIWYNIAPVYPVDSSGGFVPPGARSNTGGRVPPLGRGVEAGVMERALELRDRMESKRHVRVPDEPWGSNSWAVGPSRSASGNTIVAGDGHLSLTSPAFLHRLHLDTALLGEGTLEVIGLTVPGMPMMGPGTNGHVAWGHTSQTSDINDYYRDEVVLDAEGRLAATLFQGDEIPVEEIPETYVVGAVLGSDARTETISRWMTGSGRWFVSLEGTEVDGPEDDDAAVNIAARWIVAGDVDGDGVITAITGAATHFSERHMLDRQDGLNRARDVDEWYLQLQGMTSYSQHWIVGDDSGNILYTGFQGMPCRGYLPRDEDGVPLAGANPQLLIDGTLYPSFTIGYDDNDRIDPAKDDLLRCTLSGEEYPHGRNPDQGYIINSNNAGWSATFDNDLWNDPYYIGGPWAGTDRASRIQELIEEQPQTVESMAAIQGDHKSRYATAFLPVLLEALEWAQTNSQDDFQDPETTEGRGALLYLERQAEIEEAWARLEAWQTRGLIAHAGVETLYHSVTDEEIEDAIATMIWNSWWGRFVGATFNDEGLPGLFRPYGDYGRFRTLSALVNNVGPNGDPLASLDPETGESVFWDDLGTPDQTESRHELAIREFVHALDFLATPFGGDRSGGFNTTDQTKWIWGLKHFVQFESFVAAELGGDELVGGLFGDMNITPDVIPLADPEPPFGDPRRGLPGFPRPCDGGCIDAGGGIRSTDFSYGSGPVMRMVVELDPAGMHGLNIIPGGQHADPDSAFFSDQAELWLANEASEIRFYVDDVIAHAIGREVLSP
jgi:penicillin amidase